jgi:hypothetical protein
LSAQEIRFLPRPRQLCPQRTASLLQPLDALGHIGETRQLNDLRLHLGQNPHRFASCPGTGRGLDVTVKPTDALLPRFLQLLLLAPGTRRELQPETVVLFDQFNQPFDLGSA